MYLPDPEIHIQSYGISHKMDSWLKYLTYALCVWLYLPMSLIETKDFELRYFILKFDLG